MGVGLGIAEGLNAGVRNFATIDTLQQNREENALKTDMMKTQLAEWHYAHDPIGKVSDVVEKMSDIDDDSKKQIYDHIKTRFGLDPTSSFSRKDIEKLAPAIGADKSLEMIAVNGRIKKAEAEINLMPESPEKIAATKKLQDMKDALDPAGEMLKLKREQVAAETTKARAVEKRAEYDPADLLDARMTRKEKQDAIKAEAKEAAEEKKRIQKEKDAEAKTAAEEKKLKEKKLAALNLKISNWETRIKEGKADPFTQEDIDSFNEERMAIDETTPYKLETTEKNWFSKDKTRMKRDTAPAKTEEKKVLTTTGKFYKNIEVFKNTKGQLVDKDGNLIRK